ncbi:LLM class flavin-dependent oxidoreductase [Mycolicibacterium sp. CBM1]
MTGATLARPPRWGIGFSGDMPAAEIVDLAEVSVELGFGSFWINVPGAERDPTVLMATLAERTGLCDIGVGVVPLDVFPPNWLARRVAAAGLNDGRFILGVGSGRAERHQLALVRAGISALRDAAPGVRVAVGAVGPRMFALATDAADAAVTSMLSPQRAQWTAEGVAARPRIPVYMYHRVAPGDRGAQLLGQEMVAMGAWTEQRGPERRQLLGTVLLADGDLGVDLRRFPPHWTPVLRPLLRADTTAAQRRRFVVRLGNLMG